MRFCLKFHGIAIQAFVFSRQNVALLVDGKVNSRNDLQGPDSAHHQSMWILSECERIIIAARVTSLTYSDVPTAGTVEDVKAFLSTQHTTNRHLKRSFESVNDLKWFTHVPDGDTNSARNARVVSVKEQVVRWGLPRVEAAVV